MPVLKDLEKTVKKIETWQERCAELQHALRILLSENVSIADIAVTKDGMAPKKKKDMEEATIAQDARGRLSKITGNREERLGAQKEREVKSALSKGRTIVAGDEEEAPAEGEEENGKQQTLARIRKTEDILKSDQRLQTFIAKYWDFRLAGNFGRADEIKQIVSEIAQERDLDLEIVFASYDMGLGIGPDDGEEGKKVPGEDDSKDEEEPEEDPEKDNKDKDSETEEE